MRNRYLDAIEQGMNPDRNLAAIEKRQVQIETATLAAATTLARRLDALEKKARGPNAADLEFMAAVADSPADGVALRQRAAVARALEGRA